MRPTWADIDLDAIAHNVTELLPMTDRLCAVVKADAYGHGSVAVARAALEAGANWLAVALVSEGLTLRQSGITAPILVLSEPRPAEMVEVVDGGLRPTVYTGEGLAAAAAAADLSGTILPVQLKVDTGMHRVGAAPGDAVRLADAIADKRALHLESVWTHCAVADEPSNPYTDLQLDRYDEVLRQVSAAGHEIELRHAANSAVTIAHPRGRYDLVRCGIALYGIPPSPELVGRVDLRPVMTVRSEVSLVKQVRKGDRISYGLRWEAPDDAWIATVPIGYADGIRRRLHRVGGEVLIRGRRRAIAGVVTMDQLMVDCAGDDVRPGDEVVLIGEQGDDRITATEVAARLETIGYEVVCDIESRIPRRYS